MKLKFTLFTLSVFLLGFNYNLNAQFCGGTGITLSSQTEVDNFPINYPGCINVGGLTITGLTINNLNALSVITRTGGLFISMTSLTNLTGLNNVTTTGSVQISNNSSLTTLTGLNSVTSTGSITISDNALLANFNGLNNLLTVGGTIFRIYNNPVLTDLSALNHNIAFLGGILDITNNVLLSNCRVPIICNAPSTPITHISGNLGNCVSQAAVHTHCAASLPVELISFLGKSTTSYNSLNWRTASEKNTDYFEIERSSYAKEWQPISTVKATGNSTTPKEYEFFDKTPLAQNYYRLKTVDIDGHIQYSNVIYLSNTKEYEIEVFPVPTKGSLTIRFSAAQSTTGKITIYDLLGRNCYQTNLEVSKDKIEYPLDISTLQKGVYLLRFDIGGKQLVNRIVKE